MRRKLFDVFRNQAGLTKCSEGEDLRTPDEALNKFKDVVLCL